MVAYSRLGQLLSARRMTVPELNKRMREQGLAANLKSLYRLSVRHRPVERLDLRLAAALCQVLEVSLSELVMFDSSQPELRSLPEDQQSRLDTLMARSRAGSLLPAEREEFVRLVSLTEEIMLDNARLLAAAKSNVSSGAPV